MNYREEIQTSEKYKTNYVDGIEKIIEERQKDAEIIRKEYVKDIFENQNKYREEFKNMLGWPLVNHFDNSLPETQFEKLSEEDGYTIFRVQFKILDDLKMTGLFFKSEGNDKKPLVIVQHGGEGTPERISGIYNETGPYNDMLHRIRKHEVHVFAPQLLLWRESYNVKYDRRAIDARLKRVGSSITAVEVYGIIQIINYFEKQDFVSNFGMVGLSYGGFYTLYTAAIDTRIKSAISCSFFNKRDAVPWADWTWLNSAEKFDDAEIACLVYPRKLCIEIGDKDHLFDFKYGVESFDRVKEMCAAVGTEWVKLIVFEGTHEFCKFDYPIENLIHDVSK